MFPTRQNGTASLMVGAAALSFRLPVILQGAIVSPDGKLYLRIAENLALHGCYSVSDPASGSCVPAWGNQPPGYPAFVAIVASVFGALPDPVVVTQTILFCLALSCLVGRALAAGVSRPWTVAAGLFVAGSPALGGWARWVLTETLASAAFLWVLAECLFVLESRRIPILRVALAVGACAFLRWDMIWAGIPFVVIAFRIAPRRDALRAVMLVGFAAAVPGLFWLARAALLGITPVLSPIPPGEVPPGIQAFWRAAAVSQTATSALIWSAWSREYAWVGRTLREDSFEKGAERGTVDALFERLGSLPDGHPVPDDLDASFGALARQRSDRGVAARAKLTLSRVTHVWLAPDELNRNGYGGSAPGDAWRTVAADAGRVALLALGLVTTFFVRGEARVLLGSLVAMCLARSLFLVNLTMLETRYLSPCLPALEFATIAAWGMSTPFSRAPRRRRRTGEL